MTAARRWLLPLLMAAAPAVCQDETPSIQRALAGLHLGDTLEDVQRVYPPAQEWPSQEERRVHVTRLRVVRESAKSFPPDAQVLWLGLRHGRLVDIQIIYDARFSRRKSAERLTQDLALVYGEPRRSSDKFWWTDGRTVLRVFDAELPSQPDSQQSVELSTSVQLMERDLLRRSDS
jgi:hypothetical protein